MENIASSSKKSADSSSNSWKKVAGVLGDVAAAAGKIVAVSALTAIGGALGGVTLAFAAFGAVAFPTLAGVDKYLTSTGTAAQKAWGNLDPGQRQIARNIRGLEGDFRDLSRQFEPVTSGVVNMAIQVARTLLPSIGELARAGATVLDGFLRPLNRLFASDFFHGFARQMSDLATKFAPELGRSLVDLIKAFLKLFEEVGPAGAQLFGEIVRGLIDAINTVGPFIAALARVTAQMLHTKVGASVLAGSLVALGFAWLAGFGPVGWVIGVLAGLTTAMTVLVNKSEGFRNAIVGPVAGFARALVGQATIIINILHGITIGFLDMASGIVHGLAAAFGWVPSIGRSLRQDAADFDHWRANVDNTFNHMHATLQNWSTDLSNMPKVVKLEGNIQDLTAKLNAAKAQLRDPNLTATRRAQIQANISQLENEIARARLLLSQLNGTIATTYVQTIPIGGGRYIHQEHGGIVGAAGGGPRAGEIMVGEHGRELIELPTGSRVRSNPDTERILSERGRDGAGRFVLEIRSDGTRLGDLLIEVLHKSIRLKGGNVQAVLGS